MMPIASAPHRWWRAPAPATTRQVMRVVVAPLILIGTVWLAAAQPSLAQDRFSAEALTPAPAVPESLLSVWGSRPLDPGMLSLTLDGSYGRRPLSINDANGDRVADLIGSMSTFELMAGVGIVERLDVALTLRMHRVAHGTDLGAGAPPDLIDATLPDSEAAFGDIGLTPRFKVIGPRTAKDLGFGLALLLPMWLPTGGDDAYSGEGFRIEPRVAAQQSFRGIRLGLNVGYLIRPEAQLLGAVVDDMLSWGLGAAIEIAGPVSAVAEINGHLNVLADEFGSDDAPTELLAAVRLTQDQWLAQLGGGPGLVGGITEPAFRILGAVSWLPAPPAPEWVDRDYDRDELLVPADLCPNDAEDPDGFDDKDGCPDADNDKDGFADLNDVCPNAAEDQDGFEDQDGCPDADNDKDGLPDDRDACPNEIGVKDPDPTKRGCPTDRDGDRVLDALDACPDVPGVSDPDNKKNGCPPDRDGDGVLDAEDACPDSPGERNADLAKNGCPKARVEQGQIKITERIEFKTNSAKLLPSSTPILEAVLDILQTHSEITKLSVEGHTDNVGRAKRNQGLSERRAAAVVSWLTKRGIAKDRLTSVLMWRNCASRSGWSPPSSVLRFPCRL